MVSLKFSSVKSSYHNRQSCSSLANHLTVTPSFSDTIFIPMSEDYTKLIQKVDRIYGSSEGALWELIMGRFIHIGGWYSSVDLASKAGIKPNMIGVDLCSNSGEASRFLVRNRGVRKMHAVDMCRPAVERGRKMN
eukprot:739600_1